MSPARPESPTAIERVFYPPAPEPWGRRALLSPLTALSWSYGAAVRLRAALYDAGLLRAERVEGLRVISVGNLNVGGTGKTPAVLYLANLLVREGRKVGILTRGYGRRSKEPLTFTGEGPLPSVEEAGDEPLLLARRCPQARLFVGADRVAAAYRARDEYGLDTVLLDDGFQHRRLARDEDIVVVDEAVGLGNGHMLPRGPLREPRSSLRRATLLWLRVAPSLPTVAGVLQPTGPAIARATVEGTFVPEEPGASWGPGAQGASGLAGTPAAVEEALIPRETEVFGGQTPWGVSGSAGAPVAVEGTLVPQPPGGPAGGSRPATSGAKGAPATVDGAFIPPVGPEVPRVRTRYRPTAWADPAGQVLPVDALAGQPVLALAGLARPGGFLRTLQSLGVEVRDAALFPDHHCFTADELRDVEARADRQGLRVVTTEKDLVRLPGGFAAWVVRLGVEVLEGESHLRRAIGLAGAPRDL